MTKLRTAQQQISSLQASMTPATQKDPVTGEDVPTPRFAKAMKDQQDAINELDRVNKASGLNAGPAPAAGGTGGPPPPKRGPAPAMLKGKPIWPEGGKWVYEDGTEAK